MAYVICIQLVVTKRTKTNFFDANICKSSAPHPNMCKKKKKKKKMFSVSRIVSVAWVA